MVRKPVAASTPKTIRGRPPIRSPEGLMSSDDNLDYLNHSSNSEDNDNEQDNLEVVSKKILKHDKQKIINKSPMIQTNPISERAQKNVFFYVVIAFGVMPICIYFINIVASSVDTIDIRSVKFQNLKNQFSSLDDEFWIPLNVAVEDVIQLNQPKSVIFLHKDETLLSELLLSISEYSLSALSSNLVNPIVVEASDLNKPYILQDYGVFIEELRKKINTSAVVIIRNIDKVHGSSAEAFHSLCDEYNPVKEQVLFLFTLQVEDFPDDDLSFVEKKLRTSWKNLHNDKFYPLFTRISSFIVKIKN